MGSLCAGVVRERAPGERRVALVPDAVPRLRTAGLDVLVETGAGVDAWFADDTYTATAAAVVPADELLARADIVLCVQPPDEKRIAALRTGQLLIGLLEPLQHPALVRRCAELGVTMVSLDLLPRTLSRAQSMDALTSQANVAGYQAALVAAGAYDRYFPMLTTAAGTSPPAAVLVLGAGVAGLQAIATARRLGAVVTAYDVRPESKAEVESLGARFLDLDNVTSAAGAGGYARALTAAEREAQQRALDERIARFDVVITTARVPGRRPPLLVTGRAVERLRPGSVVVDMAASALGGNVEGSQPERTLRVANGVTLIGAGNLPSALASSASTAYARNIAALLAHLLHDGKPAIDLTDEIQAAVVVTHQGEIVNTAVDPSATGGAE